MRISYNLLRRVAGAALAASAFLTGTVTYAAPTISITTPAAGPVYDVRPTIVVSYSTSDPEVPLALDNLTVSVNSLNWTAKSTKTDTSATYAVSTDDALIAGRLVIEAAISDQAGAVASVRQEFDVFPTLQAVTPGSGEVEATIRLGVLGLDPDPSRSFALFSPNDIKAPFTSPWIARRTGPR